MVTSQRWLSTLDSLSFRSLSLHENRSLASHHKPAGEIAKLWPREKANSVPKGRLLKDKQIGLIIFPLLPWLTWAFPKPLTQPPGSFVSLKADPRAPDVSSVWKNLHILWRHRTGESIFILGIQLLTHSEGHSLMLFFLWIPSTNLAISAGQALLDVGNTRAALTVQGSQPILIS